MESENVNDLLHANALALVDDLVDAGVGTVVLDECHHLLSYWALVVRALIERLDDPQVIGLTATLPDLDDDDERASYLTLLGDVDFEVPTPAVVKEGDLAPYRDLVHFVRPTKREHDYLVELQREFADAVTAVLTDVPFRSWVAEQEGSSDPLLSVAAIAFGSVSQVEDLAIEDWVRLLERYSLDVLRVSTDETERARFTQLRVALGPLGFTLTDRGLRSNRSPGDLVLAFSQSKDVAAVDILSREAKALGSRLQALVVTDFERQRSGVRSADVLDADAGSARRVFAALIDNAATNALDPVLVTGSVVLVDAHHGDALLDRSVEYFRHHGLQAECRYESTDNPGVLELVGSGPDWSTRSYVHLVTKLFDEGATRCLVGTRALFGEGWDSLSLNTLLDFTSTTTSIAVQQLRGRAIRKDPDWPSKVAHHWDIVCVEPEFERGDLDVRRFERRHRRYWGVTPRSHLNTLFAEGPGADVIAPVVKGVAHVDPRLAFELENRSVPGARPVGYGGATERSLDAIGDRQKSWAMWGVGEQYSNFSYSVTQFAGTDLGFRTIFTLRDTVRAAALRIWAAVTLGGVLSVNSVARNAAGIENVEIIGPALLAVLAGGLVMSVAFAAPPTFRLFKALRKAQPPDAILLDVGRALAESLSEAGVVEPSLGPDCVRVVQDESGGLDVFIDGASPADALSFAKAYQQIFQPVIDQRYLIRRSDSRLPDSWVMPIWSIARALRWRRGAPDAWHPVPAVLATKRENADCFAAAWRRYVGGGQLLYTRQDEGRAALLDARRSRLEAVRSLAFERWK